MHPLYQQFIGLLEREDKAKCIEFVIAKLESGELDIVTLYNEILRPSLNKMECNEEELAHCIWKEHVRSSIIRSILENCYPYIIKERALKFGNGSKGKLVVICPTGELHELGARMVADFLALLGFDVTFVGANTPQGDIIAGIKYIKPDYVALSVTNFYNLSAARRDITEIIDLRKTEGLKFKVIVGGHAFQSNPGIYQELGADLQFNTFEELKKFAGGV